ncbi:efflux RND transporter periplasmic adaptor subunit [Catenovulum maritimum]|uniref:efflux RND transporter periplasmic adaptor subunit n=1 Tax=Catenovulum maritimum TaxID=1513271 RepID=UPI0006607E42|nr:efflux RND transporter periplasmic adaptor subunit [Catenovulum maritimum]
MKDSFPLVLISLFSLFIALYWFTDGREETLIIPDKAKINVQVSRIELQDFVPEIESYGRIQARTQGLVTTHVKGEVIYTSPNFRNGGFFKKGELLVSIDKRDYGSDVRVANAGYLDAQQKLLEEQARAEQALLDWNENNDIPAPQLVSRKPQLAAAEAKLLSAQAALQKAKLNLSRTDILAPYDGHTLKKSVSIGQVVNADKTLGEIYSIDALEIRLPLKNEDLNFIDLPDIDLNSSHEEFPPVYIYSHLGKKEEWTAELIRTEGQIDQASQQLHVIVQIKEPFGEAKKGKSALKIGQYVTAEFSGRRLKMVAVIPNKAIYQNKFVYLVENNKLIKRDITLAWRNEDFAIITQGLITGDSLVITPLGQIPEGILVNPFYAEINFNQRAAL